MNNQTVLNETREQLRELEATLRQERNDAWEALSDAHQNEISNSIDSINENFRTAIETAEEEAAYEAKQELELLVEKFGYEAVKSYLEDSGDGDAEFEAELKLDIEIESL